MAVSKSYLYVKVVRKRDRTDLYLAETSVVDGKNVSKTIRRLTEEEAKKYGWTPSKSAGTQPPPTQPETAGAPVASPSVPGPTEVPGTFSGSVGIVSKAEEKTSGNVETLEWDREDVPKLKVSGKVVEEVATATVAGLESEVSREAVVQEDTSGSGKGKDAAKEVARPKEAAPIEAKSTPVETARQSSTEHPEVGNMAVKTQSNVILPSETTAQPQPESLRPALPVRSSEAVETPRNAPEEKEWMQRIFGYQVEDHGTMTSVGHFYKMIPTVAGLKVGHLLIANGGDITCGCDSRHGTECEHTQAVRRAPNTS